jgi:molybdopterin-containing oxidoreductase family molybdopterin binding subunit
MFGTSYGFVGQMNAMGITAEMAHARARGMKLVVVDPVLTYAASKADEWVPIRPGTDAYLALSMMHILVNELGLVDADYLTHGTNAAYLIAPDGHYLREPASEKPLVWNQHAGRAQPFDVCPPQHAALEGAYPVDGVQAATAFTLFREHLRAYPPERAEQVTTVPARTIRRLAEEFGRAARVGATITLDGHQVPFRPAVACWYRGVSAHKHSPHSGMAVGQLNVLVGAVDMPGGMVNALAANPGYAPQVGEDGLLVPGSRSHRNPPLPRLPRPGRLRPVRRQPEAAVPHFLRHPGQRLADRPGRA